MPFTDSYPDQLLVYVPEAGEMSHTSAMFLAMERDDKAASDLEHDWISAQPEGYLDSIAMEQRHDESPLR